MYKGAHSNCSIQCCLFVESRSGNFLLQCCENLCNVGVAFTVTGYYQKINRLKIKIVGKWCYSDDIVFFFAFCPKSITTLLNKTFLCENVFWRLLDNIAQGFYLCNVDPQPKNNFVQENNLQCYFDQCGPTLHKDFTCAVLAHS